MNITIIDLNFFSTSIGYKKLERNHTSLSIITIPNLIAKFFSLFLLRFGIASVFNIDAFLPTSSWSRFTGNKVKENFYFYGDGFGYANSLKKPSWLSQGKFEPRCSENIYFIKSIKPHRKELIDNECHLTEVDFLQSISIFKEILRSKKQEILYNKISNQILADRKILIFCGTTFSSSGRMTPENEVALYSRQIDSICSLHNIPDVNVFVLLHPGNLSVSKLASSKLQSHLIVHGKDPIYCETLLDFLIEEKDISREHCIVCPGSIGPLMGSLEYIEAKNIVIPFSERYLKEHQFNPSFIKWRLKQENDMKIELSNCQ